MPGKYLEFIKAGRNVVPVEISFLQSTIKVESSGKEVQTSKWAENHHWKEIKAMLKPAVEAALKYNDQPVEKLSKSTHVAFGLEVGLAYTLVSNKDKSPLLAVLDIKKNCWTDDEDEEIDENTRLKNFGGQFKNYVPTKTYISCAIIRKSSSSTEDSKRLRKELGQGSEDVRSYFQQANPVVHSTGIDSSQITTVDKVNLLLGLTDKPSGDKKAGLLDRKTKAQVQKKSLKNSDSSLITTTTKKRPTSDDALDSAAIFDGDKKKTGEGHFDEEIRKWRYERKTIPNKNDSFWSNLNVEGSYYEERDDDGYDIQSEDEESKGHHHVTQEHNMQDLYNIEFLDDDDTFSLPDIDTPIKISTSSIHSQNTEIIRPEVDITETFNSYNRSSPTFKRTIEPEKKKSSPKKKNNALNNSRLVGGSSEEDDILPNGLTDLLLEDLKASAVKRKRKRTNSVKQHNSSINSDSYSNSGDVSFEEAIRAFEFRNIESTSSALPTNTNSVLSTTTATVVKESTSPEKKKLKDHLHPILGGFKKSPLASPTRTTLKSPTPNKASSSLSRTNSSKPTSLSVGSDKSTSPVARRIFSTTTSDNTTSPSSILSPTSQKENTYSEVEIVQEKPKRIRKAKQRAISPQLTGTKSQLQTEITKIKKEKGLRKETTDPISNVVQTDPSSERREPTCIDIDPEMPILEPMIITPLSEPRIPTPPLKTEPQPLSPSKASAVILQTPVVRRRKRRLNKAKQLVNKAAHSAVRSIQKSESTTNSSIIKRRPGRPRLRPLQSPVKIQTTPGSDSSLVNVPITSTPITECSATKLPKTLETSTQVTVTAQLDPAQSIFPSQLNSKEAGEQISDSDLFSFDNLDKSPPKFSIPSTSGGSAFSNTFATKTKSSTTTTESNKNFEFADPGSMMPPPTRRPPRTPKKTLPIVPIPVRPQLNMTSSSSALASQKDLRPELANVGVQVNPSQLSTYELLSNPNLLRAGMGLLTKFATNKMNSQEIDSRIGLTSRTTASRKKRSPSPDICSGPQPKTQQEIESELMPAPTRPMSTSRSRSGSNDALPSNSVSTAEFNTKNLETLPRSDSREDDSYMSDPDAQEGGEALVRELITRYNHRDNSLYEPEGDEFDLSQRSYCMLNVVPNYQQKSRMYKIHSKNISGLRQQEVIQQFQAVLPEVAGVFKGAINSDRHKMYLLGQSGRKHLKEMNVSVPFTNDQGMTLISLLFEYFVPEVGARLHWTDYINYVLLPESFIRIYARVNDMTYIMAETEMRYGACYDNPTQLL